jgi:hypothetical protein
MSKVLTIVIGLAVLGLAPLLSGCAASGESGPLADMMSVSGDGGQGPACGPLSSAQQQAGCGDVDAETACAVHNGPWASRGVCGAASLVGVAASACVSFGVDCPGGAGAIVVCCR